VTNASQPAANSNYTIIWGDGSPNYNSATPPSNLEHIYTGTNIWTLTYTVTGTNGCVSTQTYPVSNITNAAIGATTLGNTQQCGPVELCFQLNGFALNHPSTTYTVNFGDGSPSTTLPHPPPAQVCHTYTTSSCPGSYTFTIVANNNCSPSTVTISPIQIYTPPTAQFTNPPAACAGSNVTFTNTSFGGFNQGCNPNATYAWNFGDPASGAANTSTTTTGNHVYANPGTYTVTLTAGNAGNPLLSCGTTTFQQTICIETPPTPQFTIPSPGCNPFTAATVNTSNPGTSCAVANNWTVNYSNLPCAPNTGAFQFTGGTNGSSAQPQFNFQSVGVYTVNLNMTNSCGTFTDSETVTVNTSPIVDINSIANICAGGSVTPSAVTNGCNLPITNFAWSFPGGNPATSTAANPGPITYNTAGSYTITLTITNACGTATTTESVTVEATPVVVVNPVTPSICAGQSVVLTAGGATNYSWSPGTGLNTTSGPIVTASPSATTTYTVTGTTPAGCPASATTTVTVNPLPTVNIPPVAPICAGQSVQLSPVVGGGTPPYTVFSWSPAAGLSAANIQNPTANPASTTTYTLTVTDSNGCQGSGSVTVTINPLPTVNAGLDITLCNQPVATQLVGFSPLGGTWSGSPNVTAGGVFTPTITGTFNLTYTFTNANGCTNTDVMIVTVIAPTSANGGPDVTVCQNVPAFNLPVAGGGTWSGTNVSGAGLYTPSTVGTFTLTYSLGTGSCLTTDQIQITVNPLPVVNAGSDVAFCAGSNTQLNGAVNGGTLPYASTVWSPAGTLSNANVLNPVATPASNQNYTLTVADANNCVGTDVVLVTVNPLPAVNAGADIVLCDQPIPSQLTGFSPAGGTFSGPNVTATGVFTPSGIGPFNLTYTYTNANGCTNTDQVLVTVTPFTQANGGPNVSVCLNAPAFNLVPVTPGGTWSGSPNVTAAGVFNPNTFQTFNLTYTLGTGTCLTTDQVVVTVNPLPVANAGPDVAVCAGLGVQLNGTANGGTQPYASTIWSPAGGLSATNILNPIATPAANQNFTLTVTDANNCLATDVVLVTVSPLPAVNAGLDLVLCNQPIGQQLAGFSPLGGSWSGANVSSGGLYTPAGTGVFNLTYTFTNANGCTNTDQVQITVNNPVLANAGLDVAVCQNSPGFNMAPVTPGGTWSGSPMVNGAGLFTPSTVQTVNLTYTLGTGTCLTTDQVTVTVNPLPVVNAGADVSFCSGLSVPLNGAANGGTLPYASTIWTPGATLSNPNILNPSASPGANQNYTLTVTDVNNCVGSDIVLVTVNALPTSAFTVNPQACTNSALVIANNSVGNNTYQWDFDNGDTSGAIVPFYTYPDPGNYTITLTATNNFGCVHTSTQPAEAINPPVAALNLPVDQGCAPLLVTFENNSVGDYLSYFWDLTLSTTNQFEPAPLAYPNGPVTTVYPISLTATNYCGSDISTAEVTVTPVPVVNFGTDLDVFCSPFTVQFNNLTVGEPLVNTWDFGDGTGANTYNVGPHVYFTGPDPTVYTITLTATNDCGTDSGTYDITVLPNTVTAFFNSDLTFGCPPLTVNFTDFSAGATDVYYAFGDALNSGSNLNNPTFTFTQSGNYTVFLYADNGCSYDTTSVDIIVFDSPQLSFTTGSPVCLGQPTQFVNTSPTSDGFLWTFGDGNTSDLTSPDHIYATAGNYVVTLQGQTLSDECGGQASQIVQVLAAPVPDFVVPDQVGCNPFTVQFDNTTANGNFFEWNFGDGVTSGLSDPQHTFVNDSGQAVLFPVTLTATNANLCSADFTFNIIVSPSPVAQFTLDETEACEGPLNVQTTNNSLFANTHAWTWTGGGSSDALSPAMTFSGVGTYDIQLTASNSFGCSDTELQTVDIYPQPQALFTPILAASCPPLTTGFQNLSSDATTYLWNLGNGEFSDHPSPSLTYTQTGNYTVTLIASNSFGCADTLTVPGALTVHPVPVAAFYSIPENPTAQDLEIQFQNASIGAFQSFWTFDNGQTSQAYNPKHRFPDGGTWPVDLLVMNQFGCWDDTSRTIVIDQEFLFYIPNAFTPDGDNNNDYFLPSITGSEILNYHFMIFDRWGEKIFESFDREMAWTGNYKGSDHYCKEDVYVWRVELKYITQSEIENKTLEGHVTLLR